jgi:hypothetical protein
MRRRGLALVFAIVAVPAFGTTASAAGGQSFSTDLVGAQEVPGPADPDGLGHAVITINRGLGEVCWWIDVEGITLPATAAHIHPGVAGVAGAPIVTLSAPDASGTASGCTTVDRDLAKTIAKDPASYYVNVHNADFPAGALRGQLG